MDLRAQASTCSPRNPVTNMTRSGWSGITRSSTWLSIGLPANATSGLGLLQVCGRSRVPKPATGKMMSTPILLYVALPGTVPQDGYNLSLSGDYRTHSPCPMRILERCQDRNDRVDVRRVASGNRTAHGPAR